MKLYTIGIIGGRGRVGQETARYLINHTEHHILFGGRGLTAPGELENNPRVDFNFVDIYRPELLADFCRRCDLIVNCAGPASLIKERVALAALENGCHYVDPGGYNPLHHTLRELEQFLKDQKLTFITAVGILPGLSELFPIYMAQTHFNRLESLDYQYIGRDQWTHNSAYDIAWGVGNIGNGEAAVIYENGKPVELNLFTSGRKIKLPQPVGNQTMFPVLREELRGFVDKWSIEKVRVYGNNWGIWVSLSTLLIRFLGWYKTEQKLHRAAELIVKAAKRDMNRKDPGFMLHLALTGFKNGCEKDMTASLFFEDTYRATGICAAIAVRMILENNMPYGCLWGSQIGDIDCFMKLFQEEGYSFEIDDNFMETKNPNYGGR